MQPASWSVRLGHGGTVKDLIKRFPPRTPFKLYIGQHLQQTGWTDTPGDEESNGGTEFTLRGRDKLAPLHDDLIDSERTFNESTYFSLTEKQLDEVGLGDETLFATNRAMRQIKAGVAIRELLPARDVFQILTEADGAGTTGGIVHQSIQARLGERRYEFLKRYLDLAGLFLWSAPEGFVLTEPNANQKPIARIERGLNQTTQDTNIVRSSYENGTEHRFALYEVYGRGAGRKGNHAKALGSFRDIEMSVLGFKKRKTIRAQNVRTVNQANFMARRHCAEDRRAGFKLRYVMSGHTTPSLNGAGRSVWTVDTVVEVADELRGIEGQFYVSECTYRRSPQTETEIVLTRPEDLVFGPTEA